MSKNNSRLYLGREDPYEILSDLHYIGADELMHEALRAVKKHGWANTPANPEAFNEHKLVVLMEEVGEVATAITYDRGSKDDLKKELIQVATMSILWYLSLQKDSGTS